jgi:hypothetical protein
VALDALIGRYGKSWRFWSLARRISVSYLEPALGIER